MFKRKQKNKDNNQHRYPESELLDCIDENRIFEAATTFCKFLITMREQVKQQDRQMSQVLELRGKDLTMLQQCFDAAADCQKQTAQIANSQLERHALHPAIITVDLLEDLITQIAIQADSIPDIQPESQLSKLIEYISESRKIAALKKEHLDIIDICPSGLETLDSDRHEIVRAVNTEDKSKHRKISETLKSGLIYRGSVLRRAKVSAYRFNEKTNTQNLNQERKDK